MPNVLYITRYSDPLLTEHHPQSYDRYRFYAPMMTRLAELAGGDVYLQTQYDPSQFRDGGALSRMNETYRLPRRYEASSKIDLIVCAIFFPQGERFRADLARFERTLLETGAPYVYHDSDKEFSTSDGTDLFHPEESGYFLDIVSRLPKTAVLRDRLRMVATSIPDPQYHDILKSRFPDIPVTYMPPMCWADYAGRYRYVPSQDRPFDYSVLREHYLDKRKSLFVQRHGTVPLSVLIGSPSGRKTAKAHNPISIERSGYDVMKNGASYGAIANFLSQSRLTPSSSIYQRITSKLFEAAESRTLSAILGECLTSPVVTHPDISDLYDRLPVIAADGKTVSELARDLRTLSSADYYELIKIQDTLIDRCFSVASPYCTNMLVNMLNLACGELKAG